MQIVLAKSSTAIFRYIVQQLYSSVIEQQHEQCCATSILPLSSHLSTLRPRSISVSSFFRGSLTRRPLLAPSLVKFSRSIFQLGSITGNQYRVHS